MADIRVNKSAVCFVERSINFSLIEGVFYSKLEGSRFRGRVVTLIDIFLSAVC